MLLIAFMHVSVQIVSLFFILLAILSLMSRGVGIIIASLLRKRIMVLLMFLFLYEMHVLTMTYSFLGVQSCVSAVMIWVLTSGCHLAPWNNHLLALMVLTAVHTSLHFPFLNYFIAGGDASGCERLIGYYGGNFSTSRSLFEHCLADADGLLLERVLWSGCYGHVRVSLIVHLHGITLRLITSVIGLRLCKLLVTVHIRVLIKLL